METINKINDNELEKTITTTIEKLEIVSIINDYDAKIDALSNEKAYWQNLLNKFQ